MATPFTDEELRWLAEERPEIIAALTKKMQAEADATKEPAYLTDLHPKQREFVLDPSPEKAALCSRRAGKSHGIAVWLLLGALQAPNEMSVYIALSRNNARMIMEKALRDLERQYNIGLRFFERDNQLMVGHPNGHLIWLSGCKDSVEIEKFRGMKYKRVAIDEAASFGPFLRPLIEDVLSPALLDLKGHLCLTGTPGIIPAGVFYEVTEGGVNSAEDAMPLWPTHRWTLLDNPYLDDAAEWVAEKKRKHKWTDTHPTYQREYLGLWVRDDGALVYPFDHRNICGELPAVDEFGEKITWRYAIGLDVGFAESSAFVVVAYRPGFPELYVVEAFKKDKLIPSRFAAEVEKLMNKYNTREAVIDAGGIGKGYREEMFERWGIFVEKAEKTRKRAYIEIVRGELISGNVLVHPRKAGQLLDEWARLVWNEDRDAPDDRFDDHAADAALYVIRYIHAGNRPEIVRAPPSPEEALMSHTRSMRAEMIRKMKRKLASKDNLKRVLRDIASGR